MEVRGPVVNAHVYAYGSDVGAVVGEPVVGVLGALGLLQLDEAVSSLIRLSGLFA
jgi:hypothetical protein